MNHSVPDDITISSDAIFAFLRKWRNVAVMVVFAGGLLSYFYADAQVRRYESSADVLIEIPSNEVVDIKALGPDVTSDLNVLGSQAELIGSRLMLKRAVDSLNLIEDAEFNSELREPGLVEQLKTSLFGEPPAPDAMPVEAMVDKAVSRLRSRIDVELVRGSYIIRITATTLDAQKSARIANGLARNYIDYLEEVKQNAAEEANRWIAQSLDGLQEQMQSSEIDVEEYKVKKNLLSTSGTDLTEQQILDITNKVVALEGDVAAKQARLATARRVLSEPISNAETLTDVMSSPVITTLRSQQAGITREKAELLTRYGSEHPSVVKINNELRDVEFQIRQEVARIVESLSNELNIARKQLYSVRNSLANLKRELRDNSQFMPEYKKLESTAMTNQKIFEMFLERYRETNLQQNMIQTYARIISEAIPNYGPVSPNKKLIVAIGVVLSIFLVAAIAIIAELLYRRVLTPSDVSGKLGIPYLQHIPYTKTDSNSGALLRNIAKKQGSTYNAARQLYSTLCHSISGADNSIAITSAAPEEGKTSLALAVAMCAQHTQKKVLLIDLDYKRKGLSRIFGKAEVAGVVNLLTDQKDVPVDSLIHCVAEDSVDLMPAGQNTQDSVWRMLQDERFATLLETVKPRYDLVIIDSAPVLAVNESATFVSACDHIVLAVRWKKTTLKAVRYALELLRENGAPIIGAVLTMASPKKLAALDHHSREHFAMKYDY